MEQVFKDPQATPEYHDYLRQEEFKMRKNHPEVVEHKLIPHTIAEQIQRRGTNARHDFPMLEYRMAHDLGELVRWVDRCDTKHQLLLTPAFKGVQLELIYQGGVLHKAVNRGDGLVGKDVTLNAYLVPGIPQTILDTERVNIHGVVTIATADLMELGYADTTQTGMAVANILMTNHTTDLNSTASELLQFIPTMVNVPGLAVPYSSLQAILEAWDFVVPDTWSIKGTTRELGEFDEVTSDFKKKVLNELVYPTEGITLQVNDTYDRLTLGYTSRYPEWAIKFIMGTPDDRNG